MSRALFVLDLCVQFLFFRVCVVISFGWRDGARRPVLGVHSPFPSETRRANVYI